MKRQAKYDQNGMARSKNGGPRDAISSPVARDAISSPVARDAIARDAISSRNGISFVGIFGIALALLLALGLQPAAAATVEEALAAYQQRQSGYSQAKADLLKATQHRHQAEAALHQAEEAAKAQNAELDEARKALGIAQQLELTGTEIPAGVRERFNQAKAAAAQAEQRLQGRKGELTRADADQRSAATAVQTAADGVNGAAAAVAEARLGALRSRLETPTPVEERKEVGCGGKESIDDCKARALQEVQAAAAAKGAAVLVDALRVAELQGAGTDGARLRLTQKEIRTQTSGQIKKQEILEQGFTPQGAYFYRIRAEVVGRVPEELRAGLTPPLADGSVPEVPPLVFGGKAIGVQGRYSDNGDGTVTDKETKLQWMRCSLGQQWTGSGCSGKAKEMNWETAKQQKADFAGHKDWRLPSIEELRTLVWCSSGKPAHFPGDGRFCEGEYQQPTIDAQAFPDTPAEWFWSSSAYANYSDSAWIVHFYNGYGNSNNRYNYNAVRLVRGGQ